MQLASQVDARKLAILATSLALSGCPQLMNDGFGVVPSTSGGTAAGSTGHGTDDAGSFGGREPGGGTTALSGGGTVAATGGCHFTEFAAPEKLTGLTSPGEQRSPTLSADSLALYYSTWDTSERLYVATRNDRGRYFSTTTRVTLIGTVLSPPASPFVNGLELYFLASGSNAADRDIWLASRDATSSTIFLNAEYLGGVNSSSAEGTPWVSRDGSTLLFSSARPNGLGDMDIWKATRAGGTFSAPLPLAGVNSASRDESPVLSNDGLTLYFATARASTAGSLDIWYATRANTNEEFSAPAALDRLNTDFVETDLVLSSDETEILFVTDRSGMPQIWRATRECE